MTPEQVSALSDDELNRAMIWLYPPVKSVFITFLGNYAIDSKLVNYLADYNITMPLVVESNIWQQPPHMPDNKWHCYDCDDKASSSNINPLRAACECLVLIALADK